MYLRALQPSQGCVWPPPHFLWGQCGAKPAKTGSLQTEGQEAPCRLPGETVPHSGSPGDTGLLGRPEDRSPHRSGGFLETSPTTLRVAVFDTFYRFTGCPPKSPHVQACPYRTRCPVQDPQGQVSTKTQTTSPPLCLVGGCQPLLGADMSTSRPSARAPPGQSSSAKPVPRASGDTRPR